MLRLFIISSTKKTLQNYAGRYLISILLILAPLTVFAVSKTGTAAAQFLKVGIGPRAAALGGSFTALADDASTILIKDNQHNT